MTCSSSSMMLMTATSLQPLFNYAAANVGRVKLLIVFRRYGVEHIRAQASSYSFSGDRLSVIDVPPLSKEESESLARQVLEHLGGPMELAASIAHLTQDCSLATVVGGSDLHEAPSCAASFA